MIVKRHDIDAATVNRFKNRLEIRRMNVRWTSLETECLQVPRLHERVGFGSSMFDVLDDCTRCSRTRWELTRRVIRL